MYYEHLKYKMSRYYEYFFSSSVNAFVPRTSACVYSIQHFSLKFGFGGKDAGMLTMLRIVCFQVMAPLL